MEVTTVDYLSIVPMTLLAVWAMALMLIELVLKRKALVGWLALLGFVVAGAASVWLWSQNGSATHYGAGGLAVLQSFHYIHDRGIGRGEYYALLMISVSGIVLMASASNLIIVFIALEILSIPLYVLSGFAWPDTQSEEAAMKYFLLGAFASGFL